MSNTTDLEMLAAVAGDLVLGYRDGRCQHVGRSFIPSRDEIVSALQLLLGVLYPGFFGAHDLSREGLAEHVRVELARIHEKLSHQIDRCLCFSASDEPPPSMDRAESRAHADRLASSFLSRLPEIRRLLLLDAQAAFDGDPAARSLDEIVLAYPGFLAVSVYRIAHELTKLGVPLMPRIMGEWAHTQTGADIHPGATIGERFFIDHATGVVVGETSNIGNNVRLYQGVTLGALSLPRDEVGRVVRGRKRHPTVQDDVTIYANATVLGGETIVGKGSIIGGSVFLTKSVPPGHKVAVEPPRLNVVASRNRPSSPDGATAPESNDFDDDLSG